MQSVLFSESDVAVLFAKEFFRAPDRQSLACPPTCTVTCTGSHDEDHLEDMFIKVSLIHIDESGRVSVPDDLQAQLESYTDEDLETRRITRVQFMVWCKDNISAMASKLKIDAVSSWAYSGVVLQQNLPGGAFLLLIRGDHANWVTGNG